MHDGSRAELRKQIRTNPHAALKEAGVAVAEAPKTSTTKVVTYRP